MERKIGWEIGFESGNGESLRIKWNRRIRNILMYISIYKDRRVLSNIIEGFGLGAVS
jgi:hypothetical protein